MIRVTVYLVLIPSFSSDFVSIFEIYPQSEIPLLTKIAHLDWFSSMEDLGGFHLLPDTLIRACHISRKNRILFRVVDYRTNYSTCFSVNVDSRKTYKFHDVFFLFSPKAKLASNYFTG